MTSSDLELLQEFSRNQSEEAFNTLVRRHIDLVYSAALRQVHSLHLAQEVAQSVFIDLARNVDKLKPDTLLTAWLYQVTRRTAIDVVRSESRRQRREQLTVEHPDMNASETDWNEIKPLLDEAMEALDEQDRNSLLLRYFENKSLRDVGQALGTSEDAAQKRVSRAVERLRDFFSRRGVTVGASSLVVLVSTNAIQSAPVAIFASITATGVAGVITTATATTHTTMNWITAKIISAALAAALVSATGTYLVSGGKTKQLQRENQKLMASQKQLTTERDEALAASRQQENAPARLQSDNAELLRLRGEVGVLRRQAAEAEKSHASTGAARQLRSPTTTTAATQTQSSPQEDKMRCINQLRQMDGAMEQFALEYHLGRTNLITEENIAPYIRGNKLPECPSGGTYAFKSLTEPPTCSVPGHALPK
ncbi:MAG: hypothetical protein JWM68_4825 [Verrucomicrobiales bacterium]|nr:hypothetical protein [Verrucomicrobiales bacterium]